MEPRPFGRTLCSARKRGGGDDDEEAGGSGWNWSSVSTRSGGGGGRDCDCGARTGDAALAESVADDCFAPFNANDADDDEAINVDDGTGADSASNAGASGVESGAAEETGDPAMEDADCVAPAAVTMALALEVSVVDTRGVEATEARGVASLSDTRYPPALRRSAPAEWPSSPPAPPASSARENEKDNADDAAGEGWQLLMLPPLRAPFDGVATPSTMPSMRAAVALIGVVAGIASAGARRADDGNDAADARDTDNEAGGKSDMMSARPRLCGVCDSTEDDKCDRCDCNCCCR